MAVDVPESGGRTESPDAAAVATMAAFWADTVGRLPGPVASLHSALLHDRSVHTRRRSGIVDLTPSPTIDAAAVRMLLDGRAIRLSQLTPPDHVALLARRVRAVADVASELHDEHGLSTLALTLGAATWTVERPSSRPSAPVFVAPLRLGARLGAADDFELAVSGRWRVNPVLVGHLATEFDIVVDTGDVLGAGHTHGDSLEAFVAAVSAVPDLRIAQRVEVVNVSPAVRATSDQLAMSAAEMAEHRVVAALAGGDPLPSPADGSDVSARPPGDLPLVFDADASQRSVIHRVMAGDDVVVVHAPPGTGTTQTIANLVAALAAAGRSTLFVASARRSLVDVVDRLGEIGLHELVEHVDVEPTGVEPTAEPIDGTSMPWRRNDVVDADRGEPLEYADEVARAAGVLDAHVEALHRRREPAGGSVYELLTMLVGAPTDARAELLLAGATVDAIGLAGLPALGAQLAEWVRLGGAAIQRGASPWTSAVGRVTSPGDAERAAGLADRLAHHTVPEAMRALAIAVSGIDVRTPTSMTEWVATLDVLVGIDETLERFGPGLFTIDRSELERLDRDLRPAGRSAIRRRLSPGAGRRYRAALARVTELVGEDVPEAELPSGVAAARRHLDAWAAAAGGDLPTPTGAVVDAAVAVAGLSAEITALAAYTDDIGPHLDLADIARRCAALADDRSTARALPRLHELREGLHDAGLHDVLAAVSTRSLADDGDDAAAMLRYVWANSALEAVGAADPAIAAFDGRAHDRTLADFRRADRDLVRAAAGTVRDALADQRVGRCLATSPLGVAQLVPGVRPSFDVVVVDDTARLPVAVAIPALLRGRQVVAFGDPGQLPPAAAPSTAARGHDGPLFDALAAVATSTSRVTLDHHYRSRDERLVAFCAAQPDLYDGAITTLPAADASATAAHIRVSRAADRSEVGAVVQAVLDHVVAHPDRTLGVVAFDSDHALVVREAVRLLRAEHPALDTFCERHSDRWPLFVHSVDHAHGEVRDHVIVTLGGPPTDPRQRVRGITPLAGDVGTRRLNVALTRARVTTTIVTAFDADDLDDHVHAGGGVAMLQRCLRSLAADGSVRPAAAPTMPGLDPLELDLVGALTASGLPVTTSFGSSNDPIRIALMHPQHPDRGVLAVETDGPAYAARRGARDRDRLRSEHLERLGWHVHHVWSIDWLRNRDAALERIVAAWRVALDSPEPSA